MSDPTPTLPQFEKEPSITPRSWYLRGRILWQFLATMLLAVCLIGLLVGGVRGGSWMVSQLTMPSPPEGMIVVAKRELKPYQRLEEADIMLGKVDHAVAGTVMTNTLSLINQSIVLQAHKKGDALTTESLVTFPETVILTDTVMLSIALPHDQSIVPALEAGVPVLVMGTAISQTVSTDIYSATVPLVAVTETSAVVAVQPDVAAQLSLYQSPWGQLIILPTTER